MRTVFFDADDTLWALSVHYNEAMANVARQIVALHPILNYQYVLDKIKRQNVQTTLEKGSVRHSFPTAVVRAFMEISNEWDIHVVSEDILDMYVMADKVHDQLPEMLPGVESTLSTLNRSGYVCKIITLGDEVIQNSKIYRSGVSIYINESIVVPEKNVDTYREIASQYPDTEQFIMIGNSIRNDINPSLEAGWHAIHIPADTWELDHSELVPSQAGKFFRVENIKETIGIINDIYGG